MRFLVPILKFIFVALIGYVLIAIAQTIVLEFLLRGRLAPDAPPAILAAATIGTIASGLIGGFLTACMGGLRPLLQTVGVVVLLSLDAVFVVFNNVGGNPILFDLGGAVTLMAATAAGGWLAGRRRRSGASPEPVASQSV